MDIRLEKVGKRYRLEWIIRNLNLEIRSGERLAIEGPNGSGKSTLQKMLSGHLSPSAGSINFISQGNLLEREEIYKHVSMAAPYIELIEDFSLEEQIQFHQGFRPLLEGYDTEKLIELSGLAKSRKKVIRFYSSGMKQRVKLLLAIFSKSELILLDEPSTNLDRAGIGWYIDLLAEHLGKRTLIVASNIEEDFSLCDLRINILDYKKKA
ncbi:MAG: ABC transporter ATP-binding protein [Bacteroidota bacterium]